MFVTNRAVSEAASTASVARSSATLRSSNLIGSDVLADFSVPSPLEITCSVLTGVFSSASGSGETEVFATPSVLRSDSGARGAERVTWVILWASEAQGEEYRGDDTRNGDSKQKRL